MIKYTDSQRTVIDTRQSNILVSASAGTGKTTVMIERIYQLILEGVVDVTNIMVVTFTNLASAEMKQKLTKKLTANKSNALVAKQLENIDQCSISTVHSFCGDIIRNYFYVVGQDPSYAIIDDAISARLRSQALDDVIASYAQDDTFMVLYNIFSNRRRDDLLRANILSQYEFGRTLVDYQGWYQQHRQHFLDMDREDNILTKLLMEDIHQRFGELSSRWSEIGEILSSYNMDKHARACFARSVECDTHRDNIEDTIRWIVNIDIERFPSLYSRDFAEGTDEQSIRAQLDSVKKDTKAVLDKYIQLFGDNTWLQLCSRTRYNVSLTDKLVEVVLAFGDKYTQLKQEQGLLDYGDLEHITLDILQDAKARSSIRERYSMVFVDEYQDTNSVQDAIFSSIAGHNNQFAVGDVKQSIYAFRGSDPTIFLDKCNSASTAKDSCLVTLNENFRSNQDILNFVNMVFSHIMTASFGRIDYKATAMLEGGKGGVIGNSSVNIDIICPSEEGQASLDYTYDITLPTSGQSNAEGSVISQRIQEVVGTNILLADGSIRTVGYGDIAILCRSYTDRERAVYNRLIADNIPVYSGMSSSQHEGKEIRDIISILRVVDNPTNDIALVGVCRSSIGGLDEQELSVIKVGYDQQRCPMIERMRHYLHAHDDNISSKISQLLSLIDELRLLASSSTVHSVVLYLMNHCQYHLHIEAMPNGHLRTRQLYRYIDSLMGKSYNQSVDKYLHYIDSTTDRGARDAVIADNAVRMMTMHGSKGLEFPVVFVISTDKSFRMDYPRLLCNQHIGLALDYYDMDTHTKSPTVGGYCTNMTLNTSAREEEMRILYVALTRAQHHLYIVAVGRDLVDTSDKKVLSANSYAQWIMSAVNAIQDERSNISDIVNIKIWKGDWDSTAVNASKMCPQDEDITSVLDSMNYQYPYSTDVPSKVVSSMLDRAHLEQDEADTVVSLGNYEQSPLLIGTAYHAVYEKIDANSSIEDIDQVISQLVEGGKIAEDIAHHVSSTVVYDTMHNTDLASLMQGKVYREIPFMLDVPLRDIMQCEHSDNVILQGIIDMLIVKEGRAIVIDYKYINSCDNLTERYGKQLHSYKIAVQRITGIAEVDTYILSIKHNQLISV